MKLKEGIFLCLILGVVIRVKSDQNDVCWGPSSDLLLRHLNKSQETNLTDEKMELIKGFIKKQVKEIREDLNKTLRER